MFKRLFSKIFLLLGTILFLFNFQLFSFADEIDNSEEVDVFSSIEENSNIANGVDLSSLNLNTRACVVFDRTSKRALLGKNEYNKVKMASTTKIMTAIVGNDAAVALAETAGGSIDGFSELMNNKAKELGLNNTHYESPHGLDSDRSLYYRL